MFPQSITLPLNLVVGTHVVDTDSTVRFDAALPRGTDTPTTCAVTVFDLRDGRRIIVCTELAENQGRSVTNAWPDLATVLLDGFGHDISPSKAVFVEHYAGNSVSYQGDDAPWETFDLVEIEWRDRVAVQASWKHIEQRGKRRA